MSMLLSPNLKEIRQGQKALIYDPKTGQRLILKNHSLELLDQLRCGKEIDDIREEYKNDSFDQLTNILIEKKFLLTNKDAAPGFNFSRTEAEIESGFLLRHLRLNVIEDCNLDCTYCYERVSNVWNKKRKMSWQVAEKSLNEFLSLVTSQRANFVSIRFFGGEPLLNWDVVKKSIEYVKTIKPDYLTINYIINTNGTLLNDEKCKFLSEQNVHIALSMDGIKENHDAHRKYLNGEGSFSIIERNLSHLASNHCKFNISAVCTDENLPNINAFIDFIADKQNELNCNIPICFNFVNTIDKTGIDSLSETDKTTMLTKGLRHAKQKNVTSFGGLTHFVLQSFLDRNIGSHCAGSGGEFSIDPDGDIYPCSGVDLKLGNIEHFRDVFKADAYKKVVNHRCGRIKQCEGCEIEGFCGGGCIADTKTKNGDYFGAYKDCETEKSLFRELAVEYLLNHSQ